MKKIVFTVLCAVVLFSFFRKKILSPPTPAPFPAVQTPTLPPPVPIKTTSLFVPYWNSADVLLFAPRIDELSQTPAVIYFGISPNAHGINTQDTGYRNLQGFTDTVSGSPPLLTVRMLDDTVTFSILENRDSQTKIITETISIAQKYGFKGIVVDLEPKALPTKKTIDEISTFIRTFSIAATKSHLSLGMTMYGDVFYRARPFDLKALEPFVDQFYFMAYDLHKSFGTPGPNFPLFGKRQFGYDLEQLVKDIDFLPDHKKTFVFGMYGYDWLVDEKKRPIRPAKALPLTVIREKFLQKCGEKNCVVRRLTDAKEVEVNYVDSSAQYHIVWFEDETSAGEKITYLRSRGIGNFAFWVWGYY